MPKRAATEIARGKPKAAKTPGGKDRCDICYKCDGAKHMLFVNGRWRHKKCWPALEKIQDEWVMPALLCDDNPWFHLTYARPFGEVVICAHDRFNHYEKYYDLMNKEFMMKQVNCVSKGVRAELIQTAGTSQYVNVALALAAR
jgi:hypothetical protein